MLHCWLTIKKTPVRSLGILCADMATVAYTTSVIGRLEFKLPIPSSRLESKLIQSEAVGGVPVTARPHLVNRARVIFCRPGQLIVYGPCVGVPKKHDRNILSILLQFSQPLHLKAIDLSTSETSKTLAGLQLT